MKVVFIYDVLSFLSSCLGLKKAMRFFFVNSVTYLMFETGDNVGDDSECDGVNVSFGRSHYLAYHYYYCVAEVELMTHEKVFSAVARGECGAAPQ